MPGQCYGCGVEFGVFKKEHGCKNCGFAFCSKCLPQKLAIPKLKNEKHSVCRKCYNILTGKTKPDDAAKFEPPKAYLQRMAALEERESSGSSGSSKAPQASRDQPKGDVNPRLMNKTDVQIAQRLQKLKERPPDAKPVPSAKEMEERLSKLKERDTELPSSGEIEGRLAKLKGQEAASPSTGNRPAYRPPDRRSQQEQIENLLEEIGDEVVLDAQFDPAADVQARLDAYKGNNSQSSAGVNDNMGNNLNKSNPDNDKSFTKNIELSGQGEHKGDQAMLDEMNALMQATTRELEVDAAAAIEGLKQDREIMEKLEEIKKRKVKEGDDKDPNQGEDGPESDSDNEEDEEEMSKNLIKQLLAESKLDEAASADGIGIGAQQPQKKNNIKSKQDMEENLEEDPDELPWCSMCNDNASLRCHGCDLDLYCRKCFRVAHSYPGMDGHKTSKYTSPKEKT